MKPYNRKNQFVPRDKRLSKKLRNARRLNVAILVVAGLGLVMAGIWGLNVASQGLVEHQMISHMRSTCEQSYTTNDGNLKKLCGREIDAVQVRGYEVLSSQDGKFWAESK